MLAYRINNAFRLLPGFTLQHPALFSRRVLQFCLNLIRDGWKSVYRYIIRIVVFPPVRPKSRSSSASSKTRQFDNTSHHNTMRSCLPDKRDDNSIQFLESLTHCLSALSHTTAASRVYNNGPVGCQFLSQSPVASQNVASLSGTLRSPQEPSGAFRPPTACQSTQQALRSLQKPSEHSTNITPALKKTVHASSRQAYRRCQSEKESVLTVFFRSRPKIRSPASSKTKSG